MKKELNSTPLFPRFQQFADEYIGIWNAVFCLIALFMFFSATAKGQGEDLRRSYSVTVSNAAPTQKIFQSVKNTWFKGNGRHIVEMKNTFKIGQNVSSINSETVKHSDFKEGFIRDFKTLTAETVGNDDFKYIVVTLKDGVIVSVSLCRNLERNALRDFILFE